MARQRQGYFSWWNAGAIVRYLDQPPPGLLDADGYLRRSSIQGVLEQFFDDGSRSFDHFTGSNLRGNFIRQDLNGHIEIIPAARLNGKNLRKHPKDIKKMQPML